ncbi:MAG: Eco57I restriction-modification methylase domain-containing protein [Gemmatimonadales bacterium]|nr:Eco57I restriction-modification methylase domain-containing protein [Gemmatimonadales bacterium]MDZ4388890.1 Eco57I restriction-modification methylase domain-containing protein [Gemmatimonadales bacterium]
MPRRNRVLRESGSVGTTSLLAAVERSRRSVSPLLDPVQRGNLGQFLTPAPLATFLASMTRCKLDEIRILDPGAGAGALSAAMVESLCHRASPPESIELTAVEVDPIMIGHLRETLAACETLCEERGIRFRSRVVQADFLEAGADSLSGELFSGVDLGRFDCAILNPPYRKIGTASLERQLLRRLGIESTNLYTGFLAIAARLLAPGGEMIAITPRSFCNGPYFEPFRHDLLGKMRFCRMHVFDSRNSAFSDDKVLQENVVFHAVKDRKLRSPVIVSASPSPDAQVIRQREIAHGALVHPDDPHAVIHIVPEPGGASLRRRLGRLGGSLASLRIGVSTGRVVDFRAKALLRAQPEPESAPLIYPVHFKDGFVDWPGTQIRKPNALALGPGSTELLVPTGCYVLTKRFTSKEERRRIVAAVFDGDRVGGPAVAFENHLNYFHRDGAGLPRTLALGLAMFLNSTIIDQYFRQFSGHTQVNASDLRSLPYPSESDLTALGEQVDGILPDQLITDELVGKLVSDD